jgi:hypothetical protein
MNVDLPMTSDGRHCDFAPALMLVLSRLLPEPTAAKVKETDPETERMRKQILARWGVKREEW